MRYLVLVLILVCSGLTGGLAKPQEIKPGCRYDGHRYLESENVVTAEPCLQCRCLDGSLRCRLRVCPRLPQSPPPGCHVRRPAENTCCPELVCGFNTLVEEDESENALQQSKPASPSSSRSEEEELSSGCVYEGVRYGPGSAMMGSRRCEYCYCISGSRRCIRPKCLLPLPGCAPLYAPHSCCPVAYNCTRLNSELSTTHVAVSANGCRTGQRVYQEGEMVRDIAWKAACDNCFCAMGSIRCVPLACAPPLQGCKPIVREGQCCPSTYNCSVSGGTIQVKATQNYASYAFISKDYAKFRKETNFYPAIQDVALQVEGRGHRVVNEPAEVVASEKLSTSTTESILSTLETETMNNEILVETTTDYPRRTTVRDQKQLTTLPTLQPQSSSSPTTINISSDPSTTTAGSTSESATATTLTEDDQTTADASNEEFSTTTMPSTSEEMEEELTTVITTAEPRRSRPISIVSKNCSTSSGGVIEYSTFEKPKLEEKTNSSTQSPSSSSSSSSVVKKEELVLSVPEDTLVMNVTVKTNVAVGNIHGVTINPPSHKPDIEAILNITSNRRKEDADYGNQEYDYSEPTLPPSLPNVRIIPFVAADALVKDKDDEDSPAVTGYPTSAVAVPPPDLSPKDASTFYDIQVGNLENRFHPPKKTEGGFVPKESSFFDPMLYRPPNLSLEIGTGVTVASADSIVSAAANPHRKSDEQLLSNCMYDEHEYGHGEVLPNRALCKICICYYGEIVCSDQKCPPLKIGCKRVKDPSDKCCSKIVCLKGEESPTVVLDRSNSSLKVRHEPTVSPDPFRDVIKTEPAPDLPSLIGDMMIIQQVDQQQQRPITVSTTTPSSDLVTTTKLEEQTVGNSTEDESIFSLDSVFDLFFSDSSKSPSVVEEDTMTTTTTTTVTPMATSTDSLDYRTSSSSSESSVVVSTKEPSGGEVGSPGLLKLAGCNIYGRMYHVGRIITELASPCLECTCTELGVQCKPRSC